MRKTRAAATLDAAVIRLASQTTMMNAALGMGGPTCVLPDLAHPTVTAALRVLELVEGTTTFTGTSESPPTAFQALTASLFVDANGLPSDAFDLRAINATTPYGEMTRAEEGGIDQAVVDLSRRSSAMNVGLAAGGSSWKLTELINPVLQAAVEVSRLFEDRAVFTGVGGLPLKPAADIYDMLLDNLGGQEAFNQMLAEDEQRERSERGMPQGEMLPFAEVPCGWCGAEAGERHSAIACVPAGTESWAQPTAAAGKPSTATRPSGSEAPLYLTMRASSFTESCQSCGRVINVTGHCGC